MKFGLHWYFSKASLCHLYEHSRENFLSWTVTEICQKPLQKTPRFSTLPAGDIIFRRRSQYTKIYSRIWEFRCENLPWDGLTCLGEALRDLSSNKHLSTCPGKFMDQTAFLHNFQPFILQFLSPLRPNIPWICVLEGHRAQRGLGWEVTNFCLPSNTWVRHFNLENF